MDIMMAFATARAGTKCSICNKRVSHAVYQRHIEKCKIPEDDDDIVFLQEIPGNQIPANRKSRNCMKKEISSQCKSILSKTTSSVKRGQACLIQAHSANSNLVLPTLHNGNISELKYCEFSFIESSIGSEGALSHSLSDENMNVRPGPYNRDDADQLIISHSVSSKRDSVLQTRKSISSADQTQYNISNDNEVNVSIPLSPSSAHDHTDAPNIDGRSKRISDSSIESRRKKSRLSDQNEVEDDQCEIHPQELYRICIDKIKEWFSKHKWITVSSLEQSSQVQRHIQSQRSQTPLSSSIDNFQSQRPSSAGNRIHYSLRFFWEIVLDVIETPTILFSIFFSFIGPFESFRR